MKQLFRPLGTLALGLLIAVASPHFLYAQQGGVKRTVLQKADMVDIPGHEVVVAIAEVPPNGDVGRHTHPGTEILYVLEGSATLNVDGEPARELKPGDSAINAAGKPHSAKAGPNGVKLVGVYVVEKGKPLASPAPK